MSEAGDYLERIMPLVLHRLEERRTRVGLGELEALSRYRPRPSFAAAVGGPGLSLIAEVKRASPSKGPICLDLDVGSLVACYEAAGAHAVSVLTEEDLFQGSLDDLREAAEGTGLPLLRKDFIVDAYQVHEARAFGASAVLLIAALLNGRRLHDLASVAGALGLDVLVEVHDSAEMERAVAIEGAVIGINNRDLRTFSVSLETTAELVGLVPPGRLVVSESGIRTREDVERLAALGVDAVLVGESLLREADPGRVVGTLLDPPLSVAARPRRSAEWRKVG